LSEDFRDHPTNVGIAVGQRHVLALREHQGRADLELRAHDHVEEELTPTARGGRDAETLGRVLRPPPLELEYRLAGRALTLVDVSANLVVDALIDASP
jgi:hypothetical protein